MPSSLKPAIFPAGKSLIATAAVLFVLILAKNTDAQTENAPGAAPQPAATSGELNPVTVVGQLNEARDQIVPSS